MHTKIDTTAIQAQQHHISNLDNSTIYKCNLITWCIERLKRARQWTDGMLWWWTGALQCTIRLV